MSHPNSLKAWRECKDLFNKRELMVLKFLDDRRDRSFTDREIMDGLGFGEPNSVRPRISDLINGNKRHGGGFIEEIGSCQCSVTKVTVRLVRIARPPLRKEEQLPLI